MRSIHALHFVTRCSLVVAVLGCGGGGGGGGATRDTAAPAVLSTVPDTAEAQVEVDSTLTVRFSESMDPSTIDETTFTASTPAGPIPGIVSYDAADAQATLTPSSPLPLAVEVSSRITTAARDLAGNGLASEFTWEFNTRDGVLLAQQSLETDTTHPSQGVPKLIQNDAGLALAVWTVGVSAFRLDYWAAMFRPTVGWEPPELLFEDATSTSNTFLEIEAALDPQGNAVVVYSRVADTNGDGTIDDGDFTALMARQRRATDARWGPEVALDLPTTEHVADVLVGLDSRGDGIALWTTKASFFANASLFSSRFDRASNSWSAVFPMESSLEDVSSLHLAFDASGIAYAAWNQVGAIGKFDIHFRRFTPPSTWDADSLAETDDLADAGLHGLQVDGSEHAVFLWKRDTGSVATLQSTEFLPGLGIQAPQPLDPVDTRDNSPNSGLVRLPNGDLATAWLRQSTTFAARYLQGQGWESPQIVPDHGVGTTALTLSGDARGQLILLRSQSSLATGFRELVANVFDPLTGWGAAEVISLVQPEHVSTLAPKLAVDPNGNALAGWEQFDQTKNSLWFNRFDHASGWQTAQFLESEDGGDCFDPLVTLDALGRGTFVMRLDDGLRMGIFARVFE